MIFGFNDLKFSVRFQNFPHIDGIYFMYLHDDKAFILFYHESFAVKREVVGFFKNYKFKIKCEWTIINCLHLANHMNLSKHVRSNYSL